MRMRGKGTELSGFVFYLLTSTVGWIIIGTGLFTGGLIWGLSSHQVAYVQGGQGIYRTFLSEDNAFIILQQDGTKNYYVMHSPDYSPSTATETILGNLTSADSFSFVASTDLVKIDAIVRQTGEFIAHGHPIEKIVLYDTNHQSQQIYTNAEYSGNPDGYSINHWPYASLLMFAGMACTGCSLFFILATRKRKKMAAAAELARIEALPSPFARELGEMASPPAYQGIEQYPQPPHR